MDIEDTISKTKRKQHMLYLQELGVALCELKTEQLSGFVLPERLLDAIKLAQKITAHGAKARQYQYIGKLMRDVDAEAIAEKLSVIKNERQASAKLLHVCENWRANLLAKDESLHHFIAEYPETDTVKLRQLIRAVRQSNVPSEHKDYRKLFRLIKTIIDGELE